VGTTQKQPKIGRMTAENSKKLKIGSSGGKKRFSHEPTLNPK
jgi:hypothetical protein